MGYIQACKVNIGLKVGKLNENNYHEIASVMALASIYDKISIKKTKEQIIVKCKEIEEKENIVYKCALLMRNKYKINSGMKIIVKKKIPICAGLGGGSADAALTIKAINKEFKLGLSIDEMKEVAKTLGCDVSFFLKGKISYVTGVGDVIEEIDSSLLMDAIIYKPDINFVTKEVYQDYEFVESEANNIEEVLEAVKTSNIRKISLNIKNDLESAIKKDEYKFRYISQAKADFEKENCVFSLMSGSGSSVYAVFENKKDAKNARKNMIKKGYKRKCLYLVKIGNLK